ncbi:hypothetical protein [Candidatus Sororendozoicomonas aggregata]
MLERIALIMETLNTLGEKLKTTTLIRSVRDYFWCVTVMHYSERA